MSATRHFAEYLPEVVGALPDGTVFYTDLPPRARESQDCG